jgi:hypothetical protein
MSDLTRNHMLPCERCGRPCDAFTLLAKTVLAGNVELTSSIGWTFTIPVEARFCTFYCADAYHKTTGKRIYNPKGETIIPEGRPLHEKEYEKYVEMELRNTLFAKAIETMVIELLEENFA